MVHIPLLAHPAPRSVLLVGAGRGGGVVESQKHPSIKHIEWIELDEKLVEIIMGRNEGGNNRTDLLCGYSWSDKRV